MLFLNRYPFSHSLRFFTDILGMRLIKKTVNQDDIETYHLYFTDDTGAPGTDMTFERIKKELKV
ncbi:hypothetical protein EfmAA610_11230 [Enterococcus faecium]|nr:hypothetical protein EfmAA610_11230 [Enterococcus faecium]